MGGKSGMANWTAINPGEKSWIVFWSKTWFENTTLERNSTDRDVNRKAYTKTEGDLFMELLKALIVNDSYQRVTTKDSLDIKWWLRPFAESGIFPGNG